MSDKVEVAEVAPLPDASYKYPNPLANFTKGLGYPEWQPIDTKKEVGQILDLGFTPLLVPMLGYISGKELHSN